MATPGGRTKEKQSSEALKLKCIHSKMMTGIDLMADNFCQINLTGLTIEEKNGAHAPASILLQQLLRGWCTVAQHAEGLVAVR